MVRPWIAIVVVTACGGSGVKIDDLPEEIASARCAEEVRCGGMPDAATCKANLIFNGSDVETTVAAVKAGLIKYDEKQAARCLDSIRGDDCTFKGLHRYDDPCRNLFVGTLAMGGACFANEECANLARCPATDTSCNRSTSCCAGTCAAAPVIRQANESCDNNNRCDDGLFCKTAGGAAGTCTALAQNEGDACTSIVGCVDPFYCNLNFQTGMGTCKRPPTSGGACTANDLIGCGDAREYCDAATSKCTPRALPDASCATARCVGYAECNDTTKKCVAQPAVGQACTDTGPSCLGTTDCQPATGAGTCTQPPDGMACM
jgi:hypothetical protein